MLSILLKSRIAWAAIAFGLAMIWHEVDKSVAIRSAEEAQADKLQIASLTSLVKELQRREGIARRAGENLRTKASEAELIALQVEKELEEYVKTTNQNAECVVDSDLLGRLRNH